MYGLVAALIFVNIPKTGYVRVGTVKESAIPEKDFTVSIDEREIPILDAPLDGLKMGVNMDNPGMSEYLVRIEWIEDVPRADSVMGERIIRSPACSV